MTSAANHQATILSEVGISLEAFCQSMGWSDTTAWRYRKENKLTTTNIAGRLYIMPKDLREFNRRVEAGEFAKKHVTPNKKKKLAPEDTSLAA
jgi:hypothetical protein